MLFDMISPSEKSMCGKEENMAAGVHFMEKLAFEKTVEYWEVEVEGVGR
jgi:hypothetical protein